MELCQLMNKEEEEEEAEICHLMEDVNESDFNFTFNSSSHHINAMTVMAASNEQTLNDGAENHFVYPSGTFYGLPESVRHCLRKNRGIEKLYGKRERESDDDCYLNVFRLAERVFKSSKCNIW